eukprot:TRINITY_DN109402_c0_g1_i1.p1 TRINITY_DN109402_c0_g1~~TRINITY_DN109402_c0_g1_i1.p1  ORF type:complete len:375 (-),score=51.11 TRINITY_DN109402_c0_g1_i1:321-1445(-)
MRSCCCKCRRRSAAIPTRVQPKLVAVTAQADAEAKQVPEDLPEHPNHGSRYLDVLDTCADFHVLIALHLSARDLANASRCSSSDLSRFNSEQLIQWCASHRREALKAGHERGDLDLPPSLEPQNLSTEVSPSSMEDSDDSDTDTTHPMQSVSDDSSRRISCSLLKFELEPQVFSRWNLERLHLAEEPPRFPRLYFHFASDQLIQNAKPRLQEVVDVLRRFPGLRIKIEGFGNPSAPPVLGRAVAQARATSIRQQLLRQLIRDPGERVKQCLLDDSSEGAQASDRNPWACEDSNLGVYPDGGYDEGRGQANSNFYTPRLIGNRIQAIGLWGKDPELRNSNFRPAACVNDWDPEAKFRRVDFTVTGLDNWPQKEVF